MDDPYRVLGVRPDADEAIIEAVYTAKRKSAHPDNGGTQEEFKEVENAYTAIQSESTVTNSTKENIFQEVFTDIPLDEPVYTYSETGSVGPGESITITGEFLEVSLVGLIPEWNVSDIVVHAEGLGERKRRTVAFFEVHNLSGRLLGWHVSYMKFIDTEGYTYKSGEPINKRKLSPRWIATRGEMEADGRLKSVVLVEEMPPDAELEKIIYTQAVHAEGSTSGWVRDSERYEFLIEEMEGRTKALSD